MITIKLFWWLGNQMFQYAFGKNLAIKNNTELYLDTGNFHHDIRTYELAIFNMHVKIATKKQMPFYQIEIKNPLLFKLLYPFQWICKKVDPNYIIENPKHPKIYIWMYDFHPKILTLTWNKYLEGNWQSEKYFEKIKEIIRKDFTLKKLINDQQNKEIIDSIKRTDSVSVHIRRWDYIWSDFAWICEKPYYQQAIDYITSKIKKPTFFVFSEDIAWCKKNLNMGENVYFIDWNTKENSYKDMILMSYCKNNIIANSSFSRRWAWLNNNPNKIVIAPKKRHKKLDYKDIIPNNWIRL